MKLNLSKFKKVASDKHFTTLQHEDGHTMKLAHGGLSKSNRKELHSMPIDESMANNPKLQQSKLAKGGQVDPTQEHLLPGDAIPNKIEKGVVARAKHAYADGGDVEDESDEAIIHKKEQVDKYNAEHEDEPQDYPQDVTARMQKAKDYTPKQHLDQGGEATTINKRIGSPFGQDQQPAPKPLEQPKPAPKETGYINKAIGRPFAKGGMMGDRPVRNVKKSVMGSIGHKMFAEGGDAEQDLPPVPAAAQPDNQDQNIPDQTPPGMPPQSAPMPIATSPQGPMVQPPQAPQPGPANGPQTQDQAQASQPLPGVLEGSQQKISGIQNEALAQQQQAKEQADVYTHLAGNLAKFGTEQQVKEQEKWNEIQNFQNDINNGHIDPNRYLGSMDTGGKINTAIALALGGVGAGMTGGPNQALQFINNQIDRDIQAQKTDLGKKENLLSANLREYGDMKQAGEHTRLQMQAIALNKLNTSAAKAQGPMAQARAQQLIGDIKNSMIPVIRQQSILETINGSRSNELSGVDPAQVIPYLPGTEAQKEKALTEVGQAQHATKNHQNLMDTWDKANDENSLGSRIMHGGATPASISTLNALELPMIHDQEGRVNEYEQKTLSDLHPMPGDLPGKIADKRAGYEKFILNKTQAPFAKSLGLDLSKFQSTAPQSASMQNNAMLAAARANPNHPNSAAIIRKFGGQ